MCQYLCEALFRFFKKIIPEGIVGSYGNSIFNFLRLFQTVSIAAPPPYISNRAQGFQFLCIIINLVVVCFFFFFRYQSFIFSSFIYFILFLNIFYWLCYYSCSIPLLYSPLPCTPSPTCIPLLSLCPLVVHISSLASPFPILFLTSLCLFCTYHLCYYSLYLSPHLPQPPPHWKPSMWSPFLWFCFLIEAFLMGLQWYLTVVLICPQETFCV